MKQTKVEFFCENQYIKIPVVLGYILDRSELCEGLPAITRYQVILTCFELYFEVMMAHARLQDKHGFIRLSEVMEDIGVPKGDQDQGYFVNKLISCEWLFYSKPTDSANTDLIIQPVFDPDRLKTFMNVARVVQACEHGDFTKLLMTVPNRIPEPKE